MNAYIYFYIYIFIIFFLYVSITIVSLSLCRSMNFLDLPLLLPSTPAKHGGMCDSMVWSVWWVTLDSQARSKCIYLYNELEPCSKPAKRRRCACACQRASPLAN